MFEAYLVGPRVLARDAVQQPEGPVAPHADRQHRVLESPWYALLLPQQIFRRRVDPASTGLHVRVDEARLSRLYEPCVHSCREALSTNAHEALVAGSNAFFGAARVDRIDHCCVPLEHLWVIEVVSAQETLFDRLERDRV